MRGKGGGIGCQLGDIPPKASSFCGRLEELSAAMDISSDIIGQFPVNPKELPILRKRHEECLRAQANAYHMMSFTLQPVVVISQEMKNEALGHHFGGRCITRESVLRWVFRITALAVGGGGTVKLQGQSSRGACT